MTQSGSSTCLGSLLPCRLCLIQAKARPNIDTCGWCKQGHATCKMSAQLMTENIFYADRCIFHFEFIFNVDMVIFRRNRHKILILCNCLSGTNSK